MPGQLGPEHSLLRALRRPRAEAQLTQALAPVLGTDAALAAEFMRTGLKESERPELVATLPDRLDCRAESVLPEGRVDLAFADTAQSWQLLVEIKVDAGYGPDQVPRYLASLGKDPTRNVLLSITRDVPRYGDIHADPRWAGSVTWAQLLPDLRVLRPSNARLADQWPLFLDVLEDEGSLGFTKPDIELFHAWGRAIQARGHLEDFVDAVRMPMLYELRRTLVAAGLAVTPERAADFFARGKHGQRVVIPQRGKIQVHFQVPAGGPVRIKAGLWGWSAPPRFSVEIPQPRGGSEADVATERLKEMGFESWRGVLMERFLALDDERLRTAQLQKTVIDFAAESFGIVAESGMLQTEPVSAPPPENGDDELEVGPAPPELSED